MKNLTFLAVVMGLYFNFFNFNGTSDVLIFSGAVWCLLNVADSIDYQISKKTRKVRRG